MNINYQIVKETTQYECDYCIVGAGVAGVIIASELKKNYPDSKIYIVESGDFPLDNHHNKKLKDVEFKDLPIKKKSREFAVGGATNSWGGLTSHFEKFEIENRDYLEIKEWPLAYDKLKYYYNEVSKKYDFINTLEKNSNDKIFQGFRKRPFFAYLEAINYKKHIPEDVNLLFNAHATCLVSDKNSLKEIKISNTQTQVNSTLKARKFILAAGGLETIKLLLNSLKNKELSLGEEENNLGHYFMNHPKNEFGVLKLNKNINIDSFVGTTNRGTLSYFGISLDPEIQKSNELMNNYIRFEPRMPWNKDKLVFDFVQLLKKSKYLVRTFLSLHKSKSISMLDYAETGDEDYKQELIKNNFFVSVKKLTLYIYFRATNKKPKTMEYNVRNYIEMEPRFENRIYLTEVKDELGQNKICVDYSISDREKKSTITLHEKFNEFLQKKSIGELQSSFNSLNKWPIYTDASHHCGGTIMGIDPKYSFVDEKLKVHSLDNLYIASSSVMPTSGSQNPTFTIAALSYMLVDRLVQDSQ